MGEEKFAAMLGQHDISLGCITQYKLGPFGLQDEMRLAKRLGCPTIVTGGTGSQGFEGSELKSAVGRIRRTDEAASGGRRRDGRDDCDREPRQQLDRVARLVEVAGGAVVRPRISQSRWHPTIWPKTKQLISDLIRALGNRIAVFYAWQHGMGCMKKLPKEQELLQMPGRGDLDFKPICCGARGDRLSGWTEIFMHPVPRGIPILETTDEVTAEINRAAAVRHFLFGLDVRMWRCARWSDGCGGGGIQASPRGTVHKKPFVTEATKGF